MSFQGSRSPAAFGHDDYDFEDENEEFMDEDKFLEEDDDSDEDTEEANEPMEEYTEIKEQVYKDKLAGYKEQLQQLQDGTHPEYNRRIRRLEVQYKERQWLNAISREAAEAKVEKEYIQEKKAAVKEYEDKKIELKESLLIDMEEKRKMIEIERQNMELTIDSAEVKPVMTRQLRRRPNDPIPEKVEKRRKPAPAQINYLLDEKEIESDLKTIIRNKVIPATKKPAVVQHYNAVSMPNQHSVSSFDRSLVETRIEDGKLSYDRRWFHRGQPVFVEGQNMEKFPGIITGIGLEAICIKNSIDGNKIRIYASELGGGKVTLKRRAA